MVKDQQVALHITDKAKDNIFVDCNIQGTKIEGKGTKMLRSHILNDFAEKHPVVFKSILTSLIIGVVLLLFEYVVLKQSRPF